ncbi:unnamed protein product [Cyclocybe aegerita]|uniref:Uncharacterized protein n=1 Tax=Cyclocybe aegerita TaxID=1973307 RepID=A0A8S0XTL2_CYCAE|nr:unnamed protein product [Cyclocybe aegerita]
MSRSGDSLSNNSRNRGSFNTHTRQIINIYSPSRDGIEQALRELSPFRSHEIGTIDETDAAEESTSDDEEEPSLFRKSSTPLQDQEPSTPTPTTNQTFAASIARLSVSDNASEPQSSILGYWLRKQPLCPYLTKIGSAQNDAGTSAQSSLFSGLESGGELRVTNLSHERGIPLPKDTPLYISQFMNTSFMDSQNLVYLWNVASNLECPCSREPIRMDIEVGDLGVLDNHGRFQEGNWARHLRTPPGFEPIPMALDWVSSTPTTHELLGLANKGTFKQHPDDSVILRIKSRPDTSLRHKGSAIYVPQGARHKYLLLETGQRALVKNYIQLHAPSWFRSSSPDGWMPNSVFQRPDTFIVVLQTLKANSWAYLSSRTKFRRLVSLTAVLKKPDQRQDIFDWRYDINMWPNSGPGKDYLDADGKAVGAGADGSLEVQFSGVFRNCLVQE